MTEVRSPRLVGRILRLKNRVVHGLTPSFVKASPRLTWHSGVAHLGQPDVAWTLACKRSYHNEEEQCRSHKNQHRSQI
jgi:hypothetical protein